MDFLKERVKTVLSFIFLITLAQAQNWEVRLIYSLTDSSEILSVDVMPNYSNGDTFFIDFPKNIFAQNFKENLEEWNVVEGELNVAPLKAPFEMYNKTGFSYEIDLRKSTHIPTKAYLNYGNIQLANWQEILFDCNKTIKVSIVFENEKKRYDLGVNSLEEWKRNPTKILSAKTLVKLNNINVVSNVSNKEVQSSLEKTIKSFTYLDNEKELIVIFANDSFSTGGINYDKIALVYIDAKTSDSNPKFALQHTVLHELFHDLSPYKIRPEREALLIDKNWLAEATPEYLSLQYQLKNNLITEDEFIQQLEQKLRISAKYSGKSLFDMSLGVYKNAVYYDAFYSKGCIALFLLDLKLHEESGGKISVLNLIQGNFPELTEERQLFFSQLMNDQEQSLIYNANSFALNKYLEPFGKLYQKQIVLPQSSGSDTAEIKMENITPNKMASPEQKTRWSSFIGK